MLAIRALIVCAPFVVISLCACVNQRKLLVSEVGVGVLELYLDEPLGNSLSLHDYELHIESDAPDPLDPARPFERTVELLGTIGGGEFLVVWESGGHVGVPVADFYTNFDNQSVRGIAVEPGTLGPLDNTKSYAFRVYARRYNYIFPFFYNEDRSDDVVTFGPRPRPAIGGAFAETGDLDNVQRSSASGFVRGQTVWRKTRNTPTGDVPRDGDSEADFRQDDESFGKVN
jgi:hypothetical protein